METHARTIAKALTWQLVGLIAMTLIGYAFTGSVGMGGGIALASAATGLVCYVIHERVWQRVRWGREATWTPRRGRTPRPASPA